MLPGGNAASGLGLQANLGREVVQQFLAATVLFRDGDAKVLQQIVPFVEALEYRAGATILASGNPECKLGFVFAGTAAIRHGGGGTTVESLRIGDIFGEASAALGLAQACEVVAESDCTVLLLTKNVVQQLAQKVAPFSLGLAKKLATRLVQAQAAPSRALSANPAPALASVPSAQAGVIPFVKVAQFEPDAKTVAALPARVVQHHRALALQLRDRVLTVGMVDPTNPAALSELQRVVSGVEIKAVAISQDDFNEAFMRFKIDRSPKPGQVAAAEKINPELLIFDTAEERESDKGVRVIGEEVLQVVNRIIAGGIECGASDIHVETDPTGVRVRFRVSGSLVDWDQYIAPSFGKGLSARFKVLAGLDITEKRLPQDGRIGLRVGKRDIDLRLSTLPASHGEKLVLRIFEAAATMRPLEKIFQDAGVLKTVREQINLPYGAVVVAGPTGSGKSSTLYACLNERKKARPDTNIIMVEDPIEFRLQGVTQVQVNHQIELGFARVLRAMMRQDPDVIMVGEVRDHETAELALEAALTGHLLFTSVHANNAFACIQRFENLGCNRTMIAQSMALVLVQRLARRLCPHCTTREVPPPIVLEALAARHLTDRNAAVPLAAATGCAQCAQTGFGGRVAVLEALRVTPEIRNALMSDQSLGEIRKLAVESQALVSFEKYTSFLLAQGLISPSEALVTVAG